MLKVGQWIELNMLKFSVFCRQRGRKGCSLCKSSREFLELLHWKSTGAWLVWTHAAFVSYGNNCQNSSRQPLGNIFQLIWSHEDILSVFLFFIHNFLKQMNHLLLIQNDVLQITQCVLKLKRVHLLDYSQAEQSQHWAVISWQQAAGSHERVKWRLLCSHAAKRSLLVIFLSRKKAQVLLITLSMAASQRVPYPYLKTKAAKWNSAVIVDKHTHRSNPLLSTELKSGFKLVKYLPYSNHYLHNIFLSNHYSHRMGFFFPYLNWWIVLNRKISLSIRRYMWQLMSFYPCVCGMLQMLGTCLCVSDSIGSKRAVSSFSATTIFPFILIGANQNLIDNIQDSSEKFSVLKLVPIHFSTLI